MLSGPRYLDVLRSQGIEFFAGVPDSLLKDLCAVIDDTLTSSSHVITANEGSAIGMAAGYFLATSRLAMVYMQNSGVGNTVNPLLSLADPEVYSVPMLLMIGWRGEPGKKDEPQHVKQGRITRELLETLEIPYWVLPSECMEDAASCTEKAIEQATSDSRPVAIVVRPGSFEKYDRVVCQNPFPLSREDVVKFVGGSLTNKEVLVSTTGKTSRELFEYRAASGDTHERDFLTVGSMGHASQIALGIAMANSSRTVVCLDGDGAALMHLGGFATIGAQQPNNLIHVVINNGAHESVGGQATVGFKISFPGVAKACGYRTIVSAESMDELKKCWSDCVNGERPAFIEVKTSVGSRADLGRPNTTPIENRDAFVGFLKT